MLDNPSLRDLPVAVGSMSMISTANYAARRYGVRSAMPGFIALKLCPQVVFVSHNFQRYEAVAALTRQVFAKYDPDFESWSMDEASLDLTDYLTAHPEITAEMAVDALRREIFDVTGLTASAGIACNPMLAKICSDRNKPNGQFALASDLESIRAFIHALPVRKVPGVGRVCEKMLLAFGMDTCDAIVSNAGVVLKVFTPAIAHFLLRAACGCSSHTEHEESEPGIGRKSISCDRTFSPLSELSELTAKLEQLSASLAADCESQALQAKNVTIKIKFSSFEVRSRCITLDRFIASKDEILKVGVQLLKGFSEPVNSSSFSPIRLLGLRLAAFKQEASGKIEKNQQRLDAWISKSPKKISVESGQLSASSSALCCIEPQTSIVDSENNEELEFISQECPELLEPVPAADSVADITSLQTQNLNDEIVSTASASNHDVIDLTDATTVVAAVFVCPVCQLHLPRSNNVQQTAQIDVCFKPQPIKANKRPYLLVSMFENAGKPK
jgi:DNA polymerase kappa